MDSTNAVALAEAVIADHSCMKKVGPRLRSLPPDREATDRVIAAYREQRLPGWLAMYLLGCIGHAAGYETGKAILLANEGKSYAATALARMDRDRAYADFRQVVFSHPHHKVRREAASGLAGYRSAQAIKDLLNAYDNGLLLPITHLAHDIAGCGPSDAALLEWLGSADRRKRRLGLAVIASMIITTNQPRLPGKEVAAAVRSLLQASDLKMNPSRRGRLAAWVDSLS